jgi:pilus assembly protein CpaB
MRFRDIFSSKPGLNTAIGVSLAVVTGLLLLGCVSQWLQARRGGQPVLLLVAARDIDEGSVIDDGMIRTGKIPEEYVVPGSLRDAKKVIGSRAVRFIGKGEPFTSSAVLGARDPRSLASRIPPEQRAYSLQLGSRSGAGNKLSPGDHVDVLATSGDPPGTSTILAGKRVLDVTRGSGTDGDADGAVVSVTLLLSPGEAETLARAEHYGEVSVSLCPLQE